MDDKLEGVSIGEIDVNGGSEVEVIGVIGGNTIDDDTDGEDVVVELEVNDEDCSDDNWVDDEMVGLEEDNVTLPEDNKVLVGGDEDPEELEYSADELVDDSKEPEEPVVDVLECSNPLRVEERTLRMLDGPVTGDDTVETLETLLDVVIEGKVEIVSEDKVVVEICERFDDSNVGFEIVSDVDVDDTEDIGNVGESVGNERLVKDDVTVADEVDTDPREVVMEVFGSKDEMPVEGSVGMRSDEFGEILSEVEEISVPVKILVFVEGSGTPGG
ncbi:MAG: hypothetical protein M1822_007347 [Bathelium mastoideum]|nr:MAG: hypothetical protein M1822_007347 [Bathelium mastoideum]